MTAFSKHKKKKQKSFIGGVAVLTASTAVVKLIGLFYKIPMIYLVGVEGMAYFLAAYHIYTLLFTLSTAGLPIAVSILVSKFRATGNYSAGEEVYKISSLLFSFVGAGFTAVLYFFAEPIADLIDIEEAAACIRAVSPSLLLVSMGSAVKGYFQGCRNMKPTAISQIIESIGKLVLGLLFTKIAINKNLPLPEVAAAAIMGLSCGVALSTIYLFVCRAGIKAGIKKDVYSHKNGVGGKKIFKELLSISAPITLGAAVISLTSLIDTALISSRLQHAGFAASVANSMYSSYGNLSIPIFNLIPSFMAPIAISMAPMISDAAERGDKAGERRLLNSSFKLSALVALPTSLGIAVFGREILDLIFSSEISAVEVASPLLSVLAPAVFFSCLITLTNAALQSYGRAAKPIISMTVGAVVKIIFEYILVGIPSIGIFGAPVSTVLCDATIVIFNIYFIEKYTCGVGKISEMFTKPFAAAVLSVGLTSVAMSIFSRYVSIGKYIVFPIIAANVFIYAIMAAKTDSVTASDIELLPNGRRIYKIMKKIKLLK